MTVMTRQQYEDFTKLRAGYAAVPEGTLAAMRTTPFDVGSTGEMTSNEPDVGGRPEIGERALASALWATDGSRDPRSRANMLFNADCSDYFPLHRYVTGQANDGPVKPWVYGAGDAPGFTLDTVNFPNQNGSIALDLAHEPQFLFDPCILMFQEGNTAKANHYLTEMKYWVSYNFFQSPASARGGIKGIFNPHASANQPRGCAWGFRSLAMLCFVLQHYASGDDWYPWVKTAVQENVKYYAGNYLLGNYDNSAFNPYYTFATGAFRNDLGLTGGANFAYNSATNGASAIIAPWMQGWITQTFIWGYLVGLDIDSAVIAQWHDLAHFMAKFIVTLFGEPRINGNTSTYDYRRCGQYNMQVGTLPATGDPYGSVVFFANASQLWNGQVGLFFSDNLPSTDDHIIRDSGTDSASPLAERYDDNIVGALSMAVELGAVGANESFNRLLHSYQWGLGGSASFAYLPNGYHWTQTGLPDLPASGATPAPTSAPTSAPPSTAAPTTAPTPAPGTPAPSTPSPTSAPTSAPTSSPTSIPTGSPTTAPTPAPTAGPTSAPGGGSGIVSGAIYDEFYSLQKDGYDYFVGDVPAPTTPAPTQSPTAGPTATPTSAPPTASPTAPPTSAPTPPPAPGQTPAPTPAPTPGPSTTPYPTQSPTPSPSIPAQTPAPSTPPPPTAPPTPAPTPYPTPAPTAGPTVGPTPTVPSPTAPPSTFPLGKVEAFSVRCKRRQPFAAGSTPILTIVSFDVDGNPIRPGTLKYSIRNLTTNTIVRTDTQIATPAHANAIELKSSDTAIVNAADPAEDLLLTYTFDAGTDQQEVGQFPYSVRSGA